MPKKPKTSEGTEKNTPEAPNRQSSQWWKNRWFVIGASALLVVAVGIATYFLLKNDEPEREATSEELSLAEGLEQAEIADTASQEDIDKHYLNIAFSYMEEGDQDKALEYYLKAEAAGLSESAMYKDIATIYKSQNDDEKHNEYFQKFVTYMEQKAEEQEDKLGAAGTYISLGHEYENAGDTESAKEAYSRAKDLLDSYETEDEYLAEGIEESRTFVEGKLEEL